MKNYNQVYAKNSFEAAILENDIGLFAICNEKNGSFEYWITELYKSGEMPDGLKLYTFRRATGSCFRQGSPSPLPANA